MTRPPIFESYSSDLPPPGPEGLPVSKPAVFGLLLTIFQCLPVLAGLFGLILGVIGLRQIRRGDAQGRPLAWAAIVVGGISAALWVVGLSAAGVVGYRLAKAEELGDRFVSALADGDTQEARSLADTSVGDEELAAWMAALHRADADPRVLTLNLEFDKDQFDPWQLISGPYLVGGRVTYQPDDGAAPAPQRTVTRLERRGDGLRVVGLTIRPASSGPPDPLQQLERFEELFEGRHLPPNVRPPAPGGRVFVRPGPETRPADTPDGQPPRMDSPPPR